MRVCSLLALLLLSYSAVAQVSRTEKLNESVSPDQVSQKNDLNIASDQLKMQTPFKPDQRTCFFIRSYNFERQGTGAPRLKNMTTCTPAKSDQFRQTAKPKVKLIPATD